MANINFISSRRAERVKMAKFARWLLGAVAIIGTITVLTLLFAGVSILTLQNDIRITQDDLRKQQPEVDKVKAAEADISKLKPMLSTLEDAQAGTKKWHGILIGLKAAVPEDTWLNSVQVERSGTDATGVRIAGTTTDTTRVGETMSRLNAQNFLYNATELVYVRPSTDPGLRQGVEFEVSAKLIQPKKEDPNATKAK
jgi:Tfp pilus assembly protein PilN